VSSKALDEEGHCDDKAYAHEEDSIPIGRNPLSNGKEGILVEQKVLQSHKGTLCVHLSALEKDIAVALEVIRGAPALKLRPFVRFLFAASPLSAHWEVLRQLPFLPGS